MLGAAANGVAPTTSTASSEKPSGSRRRRAISVVPSTGRRGQEPLAWTSAIREETIRRRWNFVGGLYINGSGAVSVGANNVFTGTQTFRDNAFIITDETDVTKTLVFSLGGASANADLILAWAGTTDRTVTFPNATTTLAALSLAQTFDKAQTIAATTGTSLSVTPPSGTTRLIDSTYTDAGFTGDAAGSTAGIWNLTPTLSGSGINTINSNALSVRPTWSNVIDSTLVGLRCVATGTLDALDGGSSTLAGLTFSATTAGSAGGIGWTSLVGASGTVLHGATDQVTTITGFNGTLTINTGSGAITTARGFAAATSVAGTGSIATWHGFRANNPTGTGTITTAVGVSIANITKGSTNYAIDSAGGQSRHVGNFFIGAATDPTAKLHLGAGTTAASTAPYKLTSGALMTAPEVGAGEFLTDDLYFTITTGAARKGIILNDGSNLTSGRVPFATTNGRLTDDADMTFATDTLTVTKIAATQFTGNVTFADAINVITNGTTGTKIGTATSQKIGFWNAAPIVQPTTAGAAATFVANTSGIANDTATWDGYTIGQVVKALRNEGLLA